MIYEHLEVYVRFFKQVNVHCDECKESLYCGVEVLHCMESFVCLVDRCIHRKHRSVACNPNLFSSSSRFVIFMMEGCLNNTICVIRGAAQVKRVCLLYVSSPPSSFIALLLFPRSFVYPKPPAPFCPYPGKDLASKCLDRSHSLAYIRR